MKRFLLLPLLLASCAPIVGAAQGTRSTLTASGGTVTFQNADTTPALKVVVALDGPTSVSGASCDAPRDGITTCRLGDVPAGQSVALSYAKDLQDGNATWRTPEGKLHALPLSR